MEQTARFMAHVRKSRNGCWHWTGYIDRYGYGRYAVGSRTRGDRANPLAHRVAYERHHGVELAPRGHPDHRQVDHACHNRSKSCLGGPTCRHRRCANPTHLVLATPRENTDASRHAPAHVNRRKVKCVNGHPFTPENTGYRDRPSGGRFCKRCHAIADTRRKARLRTERGPIPHYQSHKTHCPHGHPYTGDNLRMRPDGSRACRTCQRAATARRRARHAA